MPNSRPREKRKRGNEEFFTAKRVRFEDKEAQDMRRDHGSEEPSANKPPFGFATRNSELASTTSKPTNFGSTRGSKRKAYDGVDDHPAKRKKLQRLGFERQGVSSIHGKDAHVTKHEKHTNRRTSTSSTSRVIKDSYEDTMSDISQDSVTILDRATLRHARKHNLLNESGSSDDRFLSSSGSEASDRSKMSRRRMDKLKQVKSSKGRERATPSYRQGSGYAKKHFGESQIREQEQTARTPKVKREEIAKDAPATFDIIDSDEELATEAERIYGNDPSIATADNELQSVHPLTEPLVRDDEVHGSPASSESGTEETERRKGNMPSKVEFDLVEAMQTFISEFKFTKPYNIPIAQGAWDKGEQRELYEEFEQAARELYIGYVQAVALDRSTCNKLPASRSNSEKMGEAQSDKMARAGSKRADLESEIKELKDTCAMLCSEKMALNHKVQEQKEKIDQLEVEAGVRAAQAHDEYINQIERLNDEVRNKRQKVGAAINGDGWKKADERCSVLESQMKDMQDQQVHKKPLNTISSYGDDDSSSTSDSDKENEHRGSATKDSGTYLHVDKFLKENVLDPSNGAHQSPISTTTGPQESNDEEESDAESMTLVGDSQPQSGIRFDEFYGKNPKKYWEFFSEQSTENITRRLILELDLQLDCGLDFMKRASWVHRYLAMTETLAYRLKNGTYTAW
ncbi:MAG: hypothetical protein M1836_004568 [Candelina mexicana]|nr:MAG: hypothetical protein M1836_004568 [Candelina mexicana]